MPDRHLVELPADGEGGVEGALGILADKPYLRAPQTAHGSPRERDKVHAVEPGGTAVYPAVLGKVADGAERKGGLA